MFNLVYAMGSGGTGGGAGGTSGGLGAFLPLIIIFAIFYFLFKGRSTVSKQQFMSPTLVLTEFETDKIESTGSLMNIKGRASGIISWLFTIIGIDSITSFNVSAEKILFKSSSLYGETQQVAPLRNISSSQCGYYKPIGYIILAGIILFAGVVAGLIEHSIGVIVLALIIAAIFFIAYALSKNISISVETYGGIVLGIRFKRSVIENVAVDIEKAKKVIEIISQKIV